MERAGRLYAKHDAGRPEPFNVFTALRSASDEVNLHSRFLKALLDHKKPGDEARKNLMDFLRHVGVENFEQHGVEVKREHDNIDILITNDAEPRQAVVIENKIWSGDQSEQLQRYHGALMQQGYDSDEIKLLYLTPYGDDPSKDSIGNLDCTAISYKVNIPPWLKRCQQRAYDEPELRESVAQYRRLVQKLTGTDFKEAYMNDLKELCLQGNNLVLVHDLNEAMRIGATASLLKTLWCEIHSALKKEIAIPPKGFCQTTFGSGKYGASFVFKDEDGPSNIPDKPFTQFLEAPTSYIGLRYPLALTNDDQLSCEKGASLCVSVENKTGIIFGVQCAKRFNEDRYSELRVALGTLAGGKSSDWWPRYQWAVGELNPKKPTRESLKQLSNDEDRKKYAQGIAQRLKLVWEAVKKPDSPARTRNATRRHTWNA